MEARVIRSEGCEHEARRRPPAFTQSVRDAFPDRFKKNLESLRQGNPLEENITTGPLARVDLAEDLEKQVISIACFS